MLINPSCERNHPLLTYVAVDQEQSWLNSFSVTSFIYIKIFHLLLYSDMVPCKLATIYIQFLDSFNFLILELPRINYDTLE